MGHKASLLLILVAEWTLALRAELGLQLCGVVHHRVVTVELGPICHPHPWQDLAEVAAEVVELAHDHLGGAGAVLPEHLVVRPKQVDRVLADDVLTGCWCQHLHKNPVSE